MFSIIPDSYEVGVELSPALTAKLPVLSAMPVEDLTAAGHRIVKRSVTDGPGGTVIPVSGVHQQDAGSRRFD
jgi:hypothetical protein